MANIPASGPVITTISEEKFSLYLTTEIIRFKKKKKLLFRNSGDNSLSGTCVRYSCFNWLFFSYTLDDQNSGVARMEM